MRDFPDLPNGRDVLFGALLEASDPAREAVRRRRLRRLPEPLTLRWGARFAELPGAAVMINPSAALALRECLTVHAAALAPFILGGGSTVEGFHYHTVVRHLPTGPDGALRPERVQVTVDLRSGFWSTDQGAHGPDLFALAVWAWSRPGQPAGVGMVEQRLVAHLGLAALDLLARSAPEAAAAAGPGLGEARGAL